MLNEGAPDNKPKEKPYEYEKEEFFLNVYRWEFLRRNKNYKEDFVKYQARIKRIFAEGKNNFKIIRPKLEKIADYFTDKYGMEMPEDPNFSVLERLVEFNNYKEKIPPVKTYEDIEKVFIKFKKAKILIRYLGWLPRGVNCLTPFEREEFDSKGQSIYVPLTDGELEQQKFIQVKIDLDVKKERLLASLDELITQWQVMRRKVMDQRDERVRLGDYAEYLRIWDLHDQGKTVTQIAKEVYPDEYDNSARNAGKKKTHYDANEDLIYRIRKQLTAATELIEGKYRKIR